MGLGEGTILEKIGKTPLVKINKLMEGINNVEIYAKLEGFNPGRSVKDRPALWMVKDGIEKGLLTKDKVIIEATSGNMGIALAMIGCVLGFKVKLYMPANVSEEKKKMLMAFGAKIRLTDPLEGIDGAIRMVNKICHEYPNKYFRPDQYNNPANVLSHYETTGLEIIEQTEGKTTHFVAGIGTGGTIMGVGRRLKEFSDKIKVIAVEPDSPFHELEGLKYITTGIVPGIYHKEFPDEKVQVSTEPSYKMVHRLARNEGLFVGQSSGAAMKVALDLAKRIKKGVIVVIFPDCGEKYFSARLWDYP